MLAFTVSAFDEVLAGTVVTWYTSASFNALFGSADGIYLHALASNVSGTSPTLTCQLEHSGDARNWVTVSGATPEINQQAISTSQETTLFAEVGFSPPFLRFVRVKMFLGGTSPQCRLKLYVAGRILGQPDRTRATTGVPQTQGEQGITSARGETQTHLPSAPGTPTTRF